MTLHIAHYTLGQLGTNTYLIADPETKEATVIDPAEGSSTILKAALQPSWRLTQVWLTHSHFDHLSGIPEIIAESRPPPPVYIHSSDRELYEHGGGADLFGFSVPNLPEPEIIFDNQETISLGKMQLTVQHTPGHSPGHVTFYCPEASVAFCGDVIFFMGIGRTDLPGGSYPTLINSIKSHILDLPPETRLLCGHGPETTVAQEAAGNPFLFSQL